jgi:hypothetical protein
MAYHNTFSEALSAAGARQPLPDLAWCVGTSANVFIDNSFLPYHTRLAFGVGKAPETRDPLGYEYVELWEGALDVQAALAWLHGGGGSGLRAGRADLASLDWSRSGWTYEDPTDWWQRWFGVERCHYFQRRASRDQIKGFARTALLARAGGPSFGNFYSALKHWMRLPQHHGDSDARQWVLEVLIPLASGSILSTTAAADGLNVQLVPGADNSALEVQLAWEEGGRSEWRGRSPKDDHTHYDIVPVGEFCVYVLKAGRVIDCYRHRGLEPIGGRDPEAQSVDIAALIARGESEECEFKEAPSDDPKNWDSLWPSIRKAVIAFANTRGGHVLLGVTDHAELVGLSHVLKHLGEGDLDEGRKRLEKLIRKQLQDGLVNAPEIRLFWEEVGGAPLMDIRVAQGAGSITHDHENNIWVRKGSTCRRPSPEELRDLLSPDSVEGPESWVRMRGLGDLGR